MLLQNLWMFKYPIFLRWVRDKCCRHISEILFVKELFFYYLSRMNLFNLCLLFAITYKKLPSWTKILRKMDVTMSNFKKKLLKTMAATNTTPPPHPPPQKKPQCWSPAGSFLISNNQLWPGWGEGMGHSQIREIGVLWVRNCKTLNTFCPRL